MSRYGRENIILQAQDWREGGFMEKKLGVSIVGEAPLITVKRVWIKWVPLGTSARKLTHLKLRGGEIQP